MAKKLSREKSVSVALFLIGIVLLIESASTMFVLFEAPLATNAGVAWVYVLIKGIVSLYVLFVGWKMMKK